MIAVWLLRPERPHMRAKTLHDIKVRWNAGRDRWFERAGQVPSTSLPEAAKASHIFWRAMAPGDVLVQDGLAHVLMPDGGFEPVDGIVGPGGILAASAIVVRP